MSLHSSTIVVPCTTTGLSNRPGFRSFKTTAPIHYPERWNRDLLVQATLDPSITCIEPVPIEEQDGRSFRIYVWFAKQRRLLIAIRDETTGCCDPRLEDTLILSRASVLAEPRSSVAREIWSARAIPVPTGDRIRILREVGGSSRGASLGRLMDCVRSAAADPAQVVLALACIGQIEIEIRSHLSPETIFKRSSTPVRLEM